MNDGIHGMLPREKMNPGVRKYRDFYEMKPGAGFYQREFGFYSLEKWQREEGLPVDADLDKLFGFDPWAVVNLDGAGWCEANFHPPFEEKILEDRGDHELVQDFAGRSVLYFKGRRNGFMPEYVDHPVKDQKTWEENCLWRLDPDSPLLQAEIDGYMPGVIQEAKEGKFVVQRVIGGYMYLRSLIGPEELLYMFYDDPQLIHTLMQHWLKLADSVIARHQQFVSLDELSFGEDICYKNGPLISPNMIREFLLPYYQQLVTNTRRRQLDQVRHMGVHVDTDGFCDPVIDLYREVGLTYMDPFEVAAGCDVLRTAKQYPDLRMSGGVDKRVLAQGKDAIDRMVDRIFPEMQKRGGFIPTCDHGVPEEVSLENYLYYRKRCLEFA